MLLLLYIFQLHNPREKCLENGSISYVHTAPKTILYISTRRTLLHQCAHWKKKNPSIPIFSVIFRFFRREMRFPFFTTLFLFCKRSKQPPPLSLTCIVFIHVLQMYYNKYDQKISLYTFDSHFFLSCLCFLYCLPKKKSLVSTAQKKNRFF